MAADDEPKVGRAGPEASAPSAREPAAPAPAREPPASAAPASAPPASAPQAQREPAPPPREPPPREPPPREMRSPLDLVPEILRRGLSAGRDVSESLIPRELASNLAAQLVDARHGLVNAIAGEVARFLRQADIASEMRKVLAGLNIEAKIQLRFSEDPAGKLQTQVESERTTARKPSKPPPSDPAP